MSWVAVYGLAAWNTFVAAATRAFPLCLQLVAPLAVETSSPNSKDFRYEWFAGKDLLELKAAAVLGQVGPVWWGLWVLWGPGMVGQHRIGTLITVWYVPRSVLTNEC